MEEMVSAKILEIQSDFVDFGRCTLSLDNWAKGLVMEFLEITHGQWLYRNVHVHDKVTRALATERKEELRDAILDQPYTGE